MSDTTPRRCFWCNLSNPLYVAYHDHEWCVPEHDERMLFELLILEGFQAGLSWECVLNKRAHFREVFDRFDPAVVCTYREEKVAQLLQDPGIIRNRRKVEAAIVNARVFLEIQAEYGTFSAYIRQFTGGRVIHEVGLTRSELSDRISADLKKRGMKFVGTTIIYSYLQAIGVLYSHEEGCFLHRDRVAR